MAASCSIKDDEKEAEEEKKLTGAGLEARVFDLGGEKRTGEEEEQRILFDTGGLETVNSSKKDLFPHTIADIVFFPPNQIFLEKSLLFSLYIYLSTPTTDFLFIEHRFKLNPQN